MGPGRTLKKVKQVRNWVELPSDVLSLIFIKLGAIDILLGAQSVCSIWRKLSKEPHLYRSIEMRGRLDLRGKYDLQKMMIEAVNKSSGQLVEFSMKHPTDEVLWSITLKCSSLRCLRLAFFDFVSEKAMIEMAKKFPQLEELELCYCPFSTAAIEAFGSSCLHLKSFRLNHMVFNGTSSSDFDSEALAIAKNMPELRHLNIIRSCLSDNGLQAILDGCTHLRSIDLKWCHNVRSLGPRHCLADKDLRKRCVEGNIVVTKFPVDGDLRKRCVEGNIISKLPDDSTHGYEFDTSVVTGGALRRNDGEEEFYENYYDISWSEDEFPCCDDESCTMIFYDYYTL